ncbi:MAG: hypothetical protein QHI48_12295 [Bacteroidota bacterium]|nr:hypothetical protein [Bacteroidota bacterium]
MKSRILSFLAITLFWTFNAKAQGDAYPRIVPLPDERYIASPSDGLRALALAKASPAFARFSETHPTWRFRPDPWTGNLHRAWGEGIPIEGFATVNLLSAPAAGMRFLRDHAEVLRVRPDELRLLYSEIAGRVVYQKYIQTYRGLDVLHSEVDLRMTLSGKVFLFGSDFHPSLSIAATPSLDRETARTLSTAGLTGPIPPERIEDGTLLILPLRYPGAIDYRLAYRFRVIEAEESVWETYVDAHNGSILWRRNLVEFAAGDPRAPARASSNIVSGRITVSISPHSYILGVETVPLAFAYINVGGQEIITDEDGRFSVDIGTSLTTPVTTRLAGPWAIARRADSSQTLKNARITTTAVAGQELLIQWDNTNSTAAERNVFYHLTAVHTFLRGLDGSDNLAGLDRQTAGIVNINNQCNAFWDASKLTVNFYKESATCGNTAEIADVIIHEFGHGVNQFLYTKLRKSTMRNGALSEATADILANMMRDDPRIGIGFLKGGANNGILRNSKNNRVYPRDLVYEIHDDGMILTGAVWDMREAVGLETARRLTHFAKYGTPDGTSAGEAFADYFIEILVADDDDGNLANGTPHSDAIIPAFTRHGIPASGISIIHDPIPDQASVTEPYPLSGETLVAASINRNLLSVNQVHVVFTTDDWATSTTLPLTVDPVTRTFSGSIPPQRAGSIVRYYLEATDNFGSSFRHPIDAPKSDFLFLVGFETKYFYDCEVQDGWTVSSECETGKWVRVKPIGTYNTSLGTPPDVPWVQPNEDHTVGIGKEKCWVTGNAQADLGLGEADVDNGYTDLRTREIDISGMKEPLLRYFRWYSNDAGANPGVAAWVVRISSDGGATWKEIENTHEANASWLARVFRLNDLVERTDRFVVEFSASDSILDKQSLVEAAVDDFEILDVNQALVNAETAQQLPVEMALEQNYPNPFNPTTSIMFALPAAADILLRVFTPLGNLVAVLAEGRHEAGRYHVEFDAGRLPSGWYTYVLESEGCRLARRMLVLK